MKAMKKITSVVLSLLMVVSIIGVMPTQTDAAIKVLTGKKTTISIGESYGIATLAKGVKYSTSNSKVASVNSKGSVKGKKAGIAKIKLSSSAGTATVKVTVTPTKVKGVKASIASSTETASNVTVSWKKVKGATGYYIYKSTNKNKGFKKAATVKKGKKTKTTIKNVAGGATYYYKVKAYAKAGKKAIASSEYSNVASVKTWKLTWSDEFNGTSLDLNSWKYETGANGWGNEEFQDYTEGKNIKFENGCLVIIPRMEYDLVAKKPVYCSSTRINTKGKREFTYGRMEIRAKASKAKGTWSAGWMLGANNDTKTWPLCGEIDILEAMNGGVPQTIHCPYFNNQSTSHGNKNYDTGLTQATAAADFHTYTAEWNETSITFMVDGRVVGVYDPSKFSASIFNEAWVFDHSFFFILNCAIGGNAAGQVTTDGWTLKGTNGNIQTYEDYYYVDYVRVYQ